MEKALERLDGVEDAEVSLAKEQAVVRYDPEKTGTAEMIVAVKEVGFDARELEPAGGEAHPRSSSESGWPWSFLKRLFGGGGRNE